MHWNLIIALRWGFAERARLLIEHGVDINTPDDNSYQTYTMGFTPYQSALMRGLPEIADLIKQRGGDASPLPDLAQFHAACMSGDTQAARRLAPSIRAQPQRPRPNCCAKRLETGRSKRCRR